MMEYKLIRSKRRTVALTVTGDLEVVVRAPQKMPLKDIERFVDKHSAWIEKHRARMREQAGNRKRIVFTEAMKAELIQKAKAYLPQRAGYFGGVMGVSPAGIKITSAKTRWGSCSGKNVICFSYMVMLLPEELIDYIVVHELTHIRVKNHSSLFYRELAKYMPDYREKSDRLRQISISGD